MSTNWEVLGVPNYSKLVLILKAFFFHSNPSVPNNFIPNTKIDLLHEAIKSLIIIVQTQKTVICSLDLMLRRTAWPP